MIQREISFLFIFFFIPPINISLSHRRYHTQPNTFIFQAMIQLFLMKILSGIASLFTILQHYCLNLMSALGIFTIFNRCTWRSRVRPSQSRTETGTEITRTIYQTVLACSCQKLVQHEMGPCGRWRGCPTHSCTPTCCCWHSTDGQWLTVVSSQLIRKNRTLHFFGAHICIKNVYVCWYMSIVNACKRKINFIYM